MSAGLVPIVAADNGVLIEWSSRGSAWLTYDAAPGGLAEAGSAGALDIDLGAFDSIEVETSDVRHSQPESFVLTLSLSDSVRTLSSSHPVETGANVFRLSDFGGIDLAHIRQIQIELYNQAGLAGIVSEASARILDISAVSDPSPGSGLEAPSLLTPASGSTVPSALSPPFTWSPVGGATGYRIAVTEYPGALPEDPAAPGCTGCVIHATTLAPSHTQPSGLPGGRIYWWRVQALPAGRWSDAALFSTTGSTALQITSPTPESVVSAESVVVRGIVTPPSGIEVSVQVNGDLALVGAGKFGATVSVDDTVKILVATARDSSGSVIARHAIPVSVQVPAEGPVIRFSAAPEMGAAPFRVYFEFTSEIPMEAVIFDAEGDGVPEQITGTDFENIRYTYPPGLYEPNVKAVAQDGTIYSASTHVRSFDPAELDLLLKPKWDALKSALRSGNIAEAMKQVLTRRQAEYTASFESFTVPLSSIDQELTSIVFEQQLGRNVDYEMLRVEDGTTYSYPVVFTLDEDGIWRLGAF